MNLTHTPLADAPPFVPSRTSRRTWLSRELPLLVMSAATLRSGAAQTPTPIPGVGSMTVCLTPGSMGVQAGQKAAIDLAVRHGFTSVEPFGAELASRSASEMDAWTAEVRERGLVWGAAGLPVEFRQNDDQFQNGVKELPRIAAALQRAGVTRMGTWLMPCHATLTYRANFAQHQQRLAEIGRILRDHGLRLGLEYVGTKTLRSSRKFPFVGTLAETRELIEAIGTGNVGLVLDSWHWWQAEDTVEDLLTLTAEDIVSVDLNDAPSGVAFQAQQDGRRELPAATGVIPVADFLGVLRRLKYAGPVRAEPFNAALNALENDAACAATIEAMRRAFAL